jgi:GDPmannose 4,6-dehydratase
MGKSLEKKRVALITGVTGQDGALLAQFLLAKNYTVWGTTRDILTVNIKRLQLLAVEGRVNLIAMLTDDFRNVLSVVSQVNPDEIYHLSGQSSVNLSFERPAETMESFTLSTLNILETVRMLKSNARLYFAGSSECFGDTKNVPADESTAFAPTSPYGVAKSAAYWLARNYREAYSLWAVTGILFNHESILRPDHFVTKKITSAALRISRGSSEKLQLGRLDIVRDWGFAPEYMEAVWMMLQQERPTDLIIGTGHSHSLEEFTECAFKHVGLDWRNHVEQSVSNYRPSEIEISLANPSKAKAVLGWEARTHMQQLVERLIDDVRVQA